MDDLLRNNEKRRLQIAETLFNRNDWMTLAELSKEVNVSLRMLKYDMENFKKLFDDFTIETSSEGVRLSFHRNKGLKTLYQNVLQESTPFQLLETIFFNESYSSFELADLLYVSPSTLYRMVNHINERVLPRRFKIEMNPCRIVGDEDEIRYFFYCYFFEKYTILNWPHDPEDSIIDGFLFFFIEFTKLNVDFALYNLFKLVTTVNYTRYKNGHRATVNKSRLNFHEIIPDLNDHAESFKYFEDTFHVKVDMNLITQLFKPFIDKGFSLSYERLLIKANMDQKIWEQVTYLEQFLSQLSEDNHIPLLNKEGVIFGVHNFANLEHADPRSGYILHNRNKIFGEKLKSEFPLFYKQLYDGLKKYRNLIRSPITEDGMNYLIYITYSYWEGLTLSLRKKYDEIKCLVVSNRHTSHSYMLKELIQYEFSNHLQIDIFDDLILTATILEELDYDFIVSNFPLPELESKNYICIEDIPNFYDYEKIQQEMDAIVLKRIEDQHKNPQDFA